MTTRRTPHPLEPRHGVPLPGPRGVCRDCGGDVVWAVTVASPRGRGGRPQPLDPKSDNSGRIAVRSPTRGRLLARALTVDEQPDATAELLAVPHAATCPGTRLPTPTEPAPDNVTRLADHRARRKKP